MIIIMGRMKNEVSINYYYLYLFDNILMCTYTIFKRISKLLTASNTRKGILTDASIKNSIRDLIT